MVKFYNILPFRCFSAIVFVYDFHPTAETLAAKHLRISNLHNGYANPFNIDGAARPFSAGKGVRDTLVRNHYQLLCTAYVRYTSDHSLYQLSLYGDVLVIIHFDYSLYGVVLGSRKGSGNVSESIIWTYVVQLSGAIRTVHASKLAFHTLHANKVLVTDKHRLRVSGAGMYDILTTDPSHDPLTALHQSQV